MSDAPLDAEWVELPTAGDGVTDDSLVLSSAIEKEYCSCPDWSPCACGNAQVEPHCMYCCKDLTPEQVSQAVADAEKFHKSWRYKWIRLKCWLIEKGVLR